MKTKINFINIQLYKYLKIIFTQEIQLYIIQYIYLLTHIKKQSMNISQKTYKNNYNPISVLQLPPKNTFIEVPTTNNEYSLLYQIDKKIYMEIYKLTIQKTKLFTNLEIYQWRKQTQFPISKNYYVNIKHNIQDNNNVQLIVYNQYCRSRLAGICQMNITQVLYMLKQSMLGFQRLVNKFGLFFINENMIRVNDKGLCRVWIHQNFSNNFPFRSQNNQQNMVKSTLQILQKYCNQSKIIKRLFSKLKQNKNFISVLRQVDNFVCSNKIIVPTKLTNFQNNKNIRLSPSKIGKSPIKTSQIVSQKTVRNSVVPLLKPTYSICQQDSISKQKFTRKNETQIKKIKSSQTIGLLNIMKKSDGQTTYKRNIKEIRPNNDTWHYNSTKQLQPPTWQESSFSRNKKWLEDFSLTIQQSEAPKVNHIQNKNKKQLTYSQSVVNPQNVKMRLNNSNNRSFCFKDQSNLPQLSLTKTLSKNSQQYSYADQFNNILQDSQKLLTASSALSPNRRLKRLDDDQNVEKLRTSHTQTVIKNNGWRSFTGLLEQHTQLNSSFHEGQQQNAYVKQIRLQKLEGLSRRGPTMSILPQDFDEIL